MASTSMSPEGSGPDITTLMASAPPPPPAFERENSALQKECDAYQPTDTEAALRQYRESLRLHMARMAQGLVARDLNTLPDSATQQQHPPSATDVQDPSAKHSESTAEASDSDPLSGAAAPRP